MSDFKTLKGLFIKHVSSDPSNLIEGQIWYNTTSQTLKVAHRIEAWASGENLTAGKHEFGTASGGTQTATADFGGISDPSPAPGHRSLKTYEYDGSSWSEGGDLPAAGYQNVGFGTQTAAVNAMANEGPAGGSFNSEAYHYNGSSWTAGGNVNTYRAALAAAGTQTAGVVFGGYVPPDRKTECE